MMKGRGIFACSICTLLFVEVPLKFLYYRGHGHLGERDVLLLSSALWDGL